MSIIPQPKSSTPLRIALLGDSRVGKSTFIQNVVTKSFTQVYYPTLKSSPTLIEWLPSDEMGKLLLNEYAGFKEFLPVIENDKLVLSPRIMSSLQQEMRLRTGSHHRSSSSKQLKKIKKNTVYDIIFDDNSAIDNDSKYEITPILLELIDTAPFNPSQIVPFLESSLDVILPLEILQNLANEPRRDHSAKPLIVCSGGNDMNGNIDGYFFVYSCLPSLTPPEYGIDDHEHPDALQLLREMKSAMEGAWREYDNYAKDKEISGEGDIFSFIYNVKSLWKKQNLANSQEEPVLPPIVIICTHCDSELKSPVLIELGKKLLREWECGFVELDNLNVEVDLLLGMLVRDIVEQRS